MAKIKNQTIKGLIIDMDGVLWLDNQPLGNLAWIFREFTRRNWKVTLATNNATRSVEQYLEKLSQFDVHLEKDQIVNSATAASHYIQARFPGGGNIYVIGEKALCDTLVEAGFHIDMSDPIAVIVSFDRYLSYEKLMNATLLIRAGVPFIATNTDRTYPTPAGLIPGAGSIVAAVIAATDTQPTVVGKPSPAMYKVAIERMELNPGSVLVIGDRVETDIVGAQQIGCQCALVLSGVTSREAGEAWIPKPDFIAPDLTNLLAMLP